jgi:hypothetical protein
MRLIWRKHFARHETSTQQQERQENQREDRCGVRMSAPQRRYLRHVSTTDSASQHLQKLLLQGQILSR